MVSPPPSLTRRQAIGGGLAFAALAIISGWVYQHRSGSSMRSPFLGDGPRRTLEAAFEALLPAPSGAAALSPSILAAGVDDFLADSDPVIGAQFRTALLVLEHASLKTFSARPVSQRRATLDAWQLSHLATKRQIHSAVRKTAFFAWYTHPDSWKAIDYDGPWG